MKSLLRKVYEISGEPVWMRHAYDRLARGTRKTERAPLQGDDITYGPRAWLDIVASWCGGFAGKRVLDVGCGDGLMISQIHRRYQPEVAIGIDLGGPAKVVVPGCAIEGGDIRSTRYEDDYFDVIVSSSAFEHIQDFDVALEEMYRILKPGGRLFSHFGPIWSTSYGHHLWLMHDGELYNYWNVILPPYCHLLMNQQELAAEVAKSHPADVSRVIAEYVFSSPEQNRLHYEDYEAIVNTSRFEVIVFKGYDVSELKLKYDVLKTPETFRVLREKFPGHGHFEFDGITLLLRKGEQEAS